jgi:alginate O-acetyltransferase complex protein AlgI
MFILIVYPLFVLIPWARVRFYFLLLACAVFHTHFAGRAGVIPIIIMGVLTYGLSLVIDRQRLNSGAPDQPRITSIGVLALAIPTAGLIYYKYRFFLFSSLSFLPSAWLAALEPFFKLGPMPLAISFFAFEFVHYLTDVIKGHKPVRNFFHFSLFSIFFPSIVSGPIKRFQQFVPQIAQGLPRPGLDDFLLGLGQVVLGFSKKLIIADNAYLMVQLLERQANWNFYSVLLLILLLSLRILFDFSGYSDIAIGLARMLGIRLPVNFNFPYLARNISDFWNRWHISLSSWIRDYLYIPLGGGRVPPARKIFNLALVMALCGLWHGAAWNFIVWGIYQGLGLGLHSFYEQRLKREQARGSIRLKFLDFPGIVARGLTLAFVGYSWLLFFYPIQQALRLTRCLFIF